MSQWSDEQVAEQFRLDIRKRFERENAEWLAEERTGLAEIKKRCDAEKQPYPEWCAERDSFFWEIYNGSKIEIVSNSVEVLLPTGFAIYPDFLEMFDHTSVAWSRPAVDARIVDGEARLVIEITLIDYWDDERHAKWIAEHPDKDCVKE